MKQPSTDLHAVFDDLNRRLDALCMNPAHDNEATRHDRLIVPVLTHPLLLGWDLNDLVGQASIAIPRQYLESHIFRGAEPRSRKPDILVTSTEFQFNALVVEEKQGQVNIDDLNGYRLQLQEYQSLYECVWGLLTDGERWILKKGLESYHTFDSLNELRAGLRDLQHCIGKQSLLERKLVYGTCDLVVVVHHVVTPKWSNYIPSELKELCTKKKDVLRRIPVRSLKAPVSYSPLAKWLAQALVSEIAEMSFEDFTIEFQRFHPIPDADLGVFEWEAKIVLEMAQHLSRIASAHFPR